MCGIAGAMTFGRGDGAATLEAVRRMVDAQAHRGPDGSGARLVSASAPAVALGHRRLAIIAALENEPERRTRGHNARRAAEQFRWPAIGARLGDLYARLQMRATA